MLLKVPKAKPTHLNRIVNGPMGTSQSLTFCNTFSPKRVTVDKILRASLLVQYRTSEWLSTYQTPTFSKPSSLNY